jgi:hypothetical protein
MRTMLLALVLLPTGARATTWRDARAAAVEALAGRKAALAVSHDARGLTYRVAVPMARGERNYAFLRLSNGDLTLRPVHVFDVSSRGSIVDYDAAGVKMTTHAHLVSTEGGTITYALSASLNGHRLPRGQVSYETATGALTAAGKPSATGPKGLKPGLRLYQLVSHYQATGGVPNEVF